MWFASKNSCNEKKCAQFSWQVKHTSIQTGCTLKQLCEGGASNNVGFLVWFLITRFPGLTACLIFAWSAVQGAPLMGAQFSASVGKKRLTALIGFIYWLICFWQWHRTPTTQETDGFQVKRPGDVSVRCTLLLMLDYQVSVCFCHGKCTVGACCNRVNSSHHVHQDIINVGSECHVVQRDYSYTELPD